MNQEKITHIRAHFQGTAAGKRKIAFQSENIDIIQDHTLLTPEQFNNYERRLWQLLDSKGYKNVSKCEIVVNFGWDKGPDIVSMELLPRQRQLVLK